MGSYTYIVLDGKRSSATVRYIHIVHIELTGPVTWGGGDEFSEVHVSHDHICSKPLGLGSHEYLKGLKGLWSSKLTALKLRQNKPTYIVFLLFYHIRKTVKLNPTPRSKHVPVPHAVHSPAAGKLTAIGRLMALN